jgi:outer membrane protein assembly factor BamB
MKYSSFAALISIVYFLFLGLKCSKSNIVMPPINTDTLTTSLKPLWKITATNDKTWNSGFEITEPVIFGQNVMVSTVFNGYQLFKMLNVQNGNEIWQWNDYYIKDTYLNYDFRISFPWLKNNYLYYSNYTELYCLDLISGQTVWKKNVSPLKYGLRFTGVDKYFYLDLFKEESNKYLDSGAELHVGNKETGNLMYLTIPKYDTTDATPNSGRTGLILGTTPFINPLGDTMLVVSYSDQPVTKDYLFRDAFGVYNLSKNKWQIERVLIGLPTVTGIDYTPIVKNGKVFHCKTGLVTCHDVNSGELLWSYNQIGHANFLFSGILVENGKVFANAGNGTLHCIDIQTGNALWQTESAGSCSDMAYLNGIIYFVGGSDGLLYAVDETTGKTIWKIISPDDGKAINKISGTFTRFCAVVPGIDGTKGRIVTHTGYNIYCFEAAK